MNGEQSDWREEKRQVIEKFFILENLKAGSHMEHLSPSGEYLLAVDIYSTGPKTWEYSRGIVTRQSDGKMIADVKRNIGHFWHAWVRHSAGNEYLLCGEDYQGYTVIDLTNFSVKNHLPDSAKNGGGFCWAAVYPSKDRKILAVEGCIWGGPYDLFFYDFSEPFNFPLPELGCVEEIGEIIGWESDSIFAVEHEFTVRKSDNRRFESLSEDEQEEYNKKRSAFSEQTEVLRWNRLTRSLVNENSGE